MVKKGFKKNKVKVDLCSYPPYIIQGVPKSGKTTLFYELVQLIYGTQDAGLLISMGKEDGFKALDDIQYEIIREWDSEYEEDTDLRGMQQLVDDLVENKEEYGIKMIGIDTYDWMVEVLINEVKRQHRKEKGEKCKSLNDAFGGFSRGKDRLVEMMLNEVSRLRDAGYAVFVLAHTKVKEKTDPLTGLNYDQLTNNLRSDIYGAIQNIAQMVVTISIDKEIVDGRLIGEKRYMNFRSNGLIDCGCRFREVPDKLELSAENFMKAFEIGVKSSMKTKKSDEELEEMKKQEMIEREKIAKAQNKKNTIKDMVSKIKEGFGDLGDGAKLKMQEYVQEAGIESLDDLSESHRTIVENMYELVL